MWRINICEVMSEISFELPLIRRMSALGFGGGAIGNLYREVTDADSAAALRAALERGLKYFDTAPHYGFGLSERRVGQGLAEFVDPGRVIVSTKVGRVLMPTAARNLRTLRQGFISPEPFESVFDYTYDGIMRSFEGSLRRLGRDIDILYVHDLGRRTHGEQHSAQLRLFMNEGYRALLSLREQGAVQAIGLGVNEWQVCEEVISVAELDIVLLAGRYTLLEQEALESFLPLCVRRGVAVVIGGPYNSGILAQGERSTEANHYDYGAASADIIARVESIRAVCTRHRVPLAAAALQFPLAHPAVVSVIPGISSAAEVADAARWMSLPIPAALWTELKEQGLLRREAPTPATS
jgi:D-threo-aldose 1-dehydrogenase